MIKNPFCNPEDTGSVSGWGTKIPHALAPQESPCATTTKGSLMPQLRPNTAK